mmetsp:Transcript_20870/g.30902  ORF Transcript_20870/g.30902 Transcript_20870/m.30902 type:complete len:167 (-) Transcript_20870:2763-3263(-)
MKCYAASNKKHFSPKRRVVKVKQFLQNWADAIDTTCVQFCSSRETIIDDEEVGTNVNAVNFPTGLNHLAGTQSLKVHITDEDLQQFVLKGGLYDGTFAIYEEDSWHVDVTMTEIPAAEMDEISPLSSPKATFPRWGGERPGWWSSLSTASNPSGEMFRLPWVTIWD